MSLIKFEPTAGKIRRSQAMSTFGIGAIVDLPRGSFMPLGLDQQDWHYSRLSQEDLEVLTIREPRLQRLLGVQEFRSAIVPGDRQISEYGDRVRKEYTLPCTRFPRWLECPACHRLGTEDHPFEVQPDLTIKCIGCDKKVNPVRFIIACQNGHIGDFPWMLWAHLKSGKTCSKPRLYLRSRGRSAALGDLYVKCQNCNQSRSLHKIFMPQALKMIKCRGNRPWLLSKEECALEVKTLQRGGSNVHFPVIASMLSIPPASEAIAKILERHWLLLRNIPDESLESALRGFIESYTLDIDFSHALSWIKRRKKLDSGETPTDEKTARLQEFEALSRNCLDDGDGNQISEFENRTFVPPEDIQPWFELMAAVTRLREVRAFCGFSRITPRPVALEQIAENLRREQICSPYLNPAGWRPGIEVRGEGIFFRLNEKRIMDWSGKTGVKAQADHIHQIFQDLITGTGLEPPHNITPRLLLVHSLSHLIIRRLSLDCGYSSASLRERLYISDGEGGAEPMAGVLIYTASPDSDGSLGGLVNMATPEGMRSLMFRAIMDADWCGNDPVCIETDPGMVGERLSGASCHSCLLVPETACEKFNRELDRAVITGFAEKNITGFFEGFPGI